ncbi:PREDICTED: LOC110760952 partial [Prunus dulcis]|uniref:PREDICTED: LOC110760952 partial n=1 Tax=Prunus dulcis TaxID=3755 RepID=A0A5E4G198_PRUDU|nr:PREDICTED: LOC110760952 partial [Prunus dulcis]
MAAAKKVRESSTRANGSSKIRIAGPKINKSNSTGDACVSDMLKVNFLSSPSACVKLVDQIHQAHLGTFSSLSLEKQNETDVHLLKKGVVFAVEAIRNSSVVAPSSAHLSELEKKNVALTGKLSAEQIHHETKMFEMKESMSVLKSSFTKKGSEFNSFDVALHS